MRDDQGAAATELLDVEGVAQELKCGRTFVFMLINSGELEAIKLGRLTRVPRQSIRVFVERKLNESRQINDNIRSGRPVGLQPVHLRGEGNRGGENEQTVMERFANARMDDGKLVLPFESGTALFVRVSMGRRSTSVADSSTRRSVN